MFVEMLKEKMLRWEIFPTFLGDLSERRLEHRKETLGWPTLNHSVKRFTFMFITHLSDRNLNRSLSFGHSAPTSQLRRLKLRNST